jgi:hypothetical protein
MLSGICISNTYKQADTRFIFEPSVHPSAECPKMQYFHGHLRPTVAVGCPAQIVSELREFDITSAMGYQNHMEHIENVLAYMRLS